MGVGNRCPLYVGLCCAGGGGGGGGGERGGGGGGGGGALPSLDSLGSPGSAAEFARGRGSSPLKGQRPEHLGRKILWLQAGFSSRKWVLPSGVISNT